MERSKILALSSILTIVIVIEAILSPPHRLQTSVLSFNLHVLDRSNCKLIKIGRHNLPSSVLCARSGQVLRRCGIATHEPLYPACADNAKLSTICISVCATMTNVQVSFPLGNASRHVVVIALTLEVSVTAKTLEQLLDLHLHKQYRSIHPGRRTRVS